MQRACVSAEHAIEQTAAAYAKLERKLTSASLATYDIFDYMGVPWISRLFIRRAHGDQLAKVLIRLLQGGLLLAPCSLRKLLGIQRCTMSGALAFLVQARCDAFQYDGDYRHLEETRLLLEQLTELYQGTPDAPTWGFPFAWPRGELVPPNTPIAYTTIQCGLACLRYAQVAHDDWAHHWAVAAARAVLTRFNYTDYADDSCSIGYTTLDTSAAVNVSALAAMFLLQVACDELPGPRERATGLLQFVLREQQPDGSWPYSTTESFIDNSHSAMVLQALAASAPLLEVDVLRQQCVAALRRGWEYYAHQLFNPDGLPRMDSQRVFPFDIATMAESVAAFDALWRDHHVLNADDETLLERLWLATVVAGIRYLQSTDGDFAARYYPPLRMQLHSLRWGNAQALRALVLTLRWWARTHGDVA